MLVVEYIYIKDKIREGMYYFVEDKRFVERTKDIDLVKYGFDGLNGLIFDSINKTINYVKTVTNRERGMTERRELFNIDSKDINRYLQKEGGFFKLMKELTNRYNEICYRFENYAIYDLFYDICYGYNVDCKGPTEEMIISKDGTNERLYFYQDTGKVVAKSGNESRLVRGVEFSNVYEFTEFAKKIAEFYENFVRYYIKSGSEQNHSLESLATKLDKVQNDRQLNKLACDQVSKYSKSGSEVKMNGRPKRVSRGI